MDFALAFLVDADGRIGAIRGRLKACLRIRLERRKNSRDGEDDEERASGHDNEKKRAAVSEEGRRSGGLFPRAHYRSGRFGRRTAQQVRTFGLPQSEVNGRTARSEIPGARACTTAFFSTELICRAATRTGGRADWCGTHEWETPETSRRFATRIDGRRVRAFVHDDEGGCLVGEWVVGRKSFPLDSSRSIRRSKSLELLSLRFVTNRVEVGASREAYGPSGGESGWKTSSSRTRAAVS